MSDDPTTATALELARALRAGETTSEALTAHFLGRIARLDPELGAFVQVTGGAALRRAHRLDRAAPTGIFHGVPTAIKDLDLVRGTFTRAGSRAFRHAWTPVDGPVASRLRRAGFVFLGKLATSEFGILPVTETDLHPPCRNPWNPAHSAGGSSGGSGAAVAAGLLPVAQGSDGAGSIRIPAAFDHLFGFKVSRGLLPDFYRNLDRRGLSTVGALTHDVADNAAFLDALAGRAYDPAAPPPDSLLARSCEPVGPLRVRVTTASPLGLVHPDAEQAVQDLAALLANMGHDVAAAHGLPDRLEVFTPIYAQLSAAIPVLRESVLQPVSRWMRQLGRQTSRAEVDRRQEALLAEVRAWWGDADVWLTPTVANPAPRVGALAGLEPDRLFREAAELGAFTAIYNLAGQPAASVPAGLSREGLPLGVQVGARAGQDAMLLALCRQIEAARPWRHRLSPFMSAG